MTTKKSGQIDQKNSDYIDQKRTLNILTKKLSTPRKSFNCLHLIKVKCYYIDGVLQTNVKVNRDNSKSVLISFKIIHIIDIDRPLSILYVSFSPTGA